MRTPTFHRLTSLNRHRSTANDRRQFKQPPTPAAGGGGFLKVTSCYIFNRGHNEQHINLQGRDRRHAPRDSIHGGRPKRRTIRLGTLPARDVEGIKGHIDLLEVYRKNNRAPDTETAKWLGTIDDNIIDKLAAGGLCEPRAEAAKPKGLTLAVPKKTTWGNANRSWRPASSTPIRSAGTDDPRQPRG